LALKRYYAQSWSVTLVKFFILLTAYTALIISSVKLLQDVGI